MDFSLEFPQISRRLLHEIVTEKLRYNKVCARWVPKLLTEGHKKQPKAASLTFLEAYEKDGDSLLHPVVTGDETCVKHMTCETKKQYMVWGHTSSPKRPRKCLQTLSARKIMANVFWNREGVLLVDFL